MSARTVAVLAAAGLAAAVAHGYTVPAGETVTVTDANKSTIETDGSIALGSAASTIIYETSDAPGVPISGAGTILKKGTSDWTLSANNASFTGTYAFSGGKTTFTLIDQLGKNDSAMHVYVTNGATLCAMDSTGNIKFKSRTLHIAGTGVNNAGAFTLGCKNNGNAELMGKMVLEGDALIVLDYQMYHRGKITLNGHTLTKDGGSGIEWFFQSGGTDNTGSIVVEKGIVRIAEGWTSDPAEMQAGPIVFRNGTSFYFRNTTPIQYRPMRIEGTVSAGNNTQYPSYTGGYTDSCRHQAGPVVLAEGALLKFNGDRVDLQNTFSGPISGAGSLTLTSSHRGRFYLANPTNSFTGTFSASGYYDNSWPDLTAAYSNSIPDYSKFSTATLRVRVPMSDDDSTWCPDSVLRLARAMTVGGTSDHVTGISLVTDDCTDDSYSFDFDRASNSAVVPASNYMRLMHEGNGKVSFRGGADLMAIPVGSIGGVTEFTGNDEFLLGEVFAFSRPAYAASDDGKEATVVFNGAKNVVLTNALVRIGSTGSGPNKAYNTGGLGRMVVTNSTLITRLLTQEENAWDTYGGFSPGCYGTGVLEIATGTIMTNRLYVGCGGSATFYDSVGAVVQNGGAFAVIGVADYSHHTIGASAVGARDGSHGYYELNDGMVTFLGSAGLARGTSAGGIFMQHGGTFIATNALSGSGANFEIGISSTGRGVFYMDGGTGFATGLDGARGGSAKAEFTIDGDATFRHAGTYICCNFNTAGTSSTTFNFNGGVFEATFFSNRFGNDANNTPYDHDPGFYFNFNGGTLKLIGTGYNRDNKRDPFSSYNGRPKAERVCVYENGATIDTADCDAVSTVPFVAPPGKGVSAIDWTADGYAAPPCVVIDGDGTNATAVALYDSTTRQVTGVRITSHGWGYTSATAYFVSGSVTNGSVACTLADNVSGPFTKKGPYTFTLNATNTWGGATILAEGCLKCGMNSSLPLGTTIVLGGGTLNMNGKTLSDGSAAPLNWAVDGATVAAAGAPIQYNGDLAFPEGATLTLLNAEMTAEASTSLLTVSGTLTGSPTLVDDSASPRNRLVWSGNTLRYRKILGSVFTFR